MSTLPTVIKLNKVPQVNNRAMLDGLLVKLDSNGTLKYFGAANWWADSVFFDLRTGALGWILY